MAFKRTRPILCILIAIICFSLLPNSNAYALANVPKDALPGLDHFVEQVKNGRSSEIRGIYIPGVLAARVVQQPTGRDDFVSPWENVLTQFNLASRFGSTGLLAHNDLDGKAFASLQYGQEIYLVYGDGHVSAFIVSEIFQYQASEPDSMSSAFVSLDDGDVLSSSELFTEIYNRPGKLILQTCMEVDDAPRWGRLFVIAEPSSN